jgi:hypothetical protein
MEKVTRNLDTDASANLKSARTDNSGLPFKYKPTQSTITSIRELLVSARLRGVEGEAAQHLVGAILQLRYPQMCIKNHPCSTNDIQLGLYGDFQINDTIIHVTIDLSNKLMMEKCLPNLREGFRVYILVPERTVHADKSFAAKYDARRIAVFSIEGFVAQNIDELSCFSRKQQHKQLSGLLYTYNERVRTMETDKSFLIDIPTSLLI